jgi:sec-independent protein translocase protein TatC
MTPTPQEMSFMEHLAELRTRILRIVLVLFVLSAIAFFFAGELFDHILLAPKHADFFTYRCFNAFAQKLHLGTLFAKDFEFDLQNLEMTGQFSWHIQTAFLSALVLGFPYLFFEIWQFVKPALLPHERKQASNIVFYSSILMLLGLLFGYFLVTPLSVQFFGTYQLSQEIKNVIRLSSYLEMVVKTTFYTGILFQLPVCVFLLTKIGIVDYTILKQYRKHALVGILIVAAILTPPDFITQIIVGFPLYLLYEFSIWVAYFTASR